MSLLTETEYELPRLYTVWNNWLSSFMVFPFTEKLKGQHTMRLSFLANRIEKKKRKMLTINFMLVGCDEFVRIKIMVRSCGRNFLTIKCHVRIILNLFTIKFHFKILLTNLFGKKKHDLMKIKKLTKKRKRRELIKTYVWRCDK